MRLHPDEKLTELYRSKVGNRNYYFLNLNRFIPPYHFLHN